jgi:hypothetical protein
VKAVFAVAMTLVAVAIVIVLSQSPSTVAGTNSVPAPGPIATSTGNERTCQQVATVPQGTSGVRISLAAGAGPRLRLQVYSGSHLVTEGKIPAGWGLTANVFIPVRTVSRTVHNARICTTIGPAVESFHIIGVLRPGVSESAGINAIALRMEFLRPAPQSWWSLLPSIFYHIGLGHAASGTWLAWLALLLMIAVAILASRLALKELR